jgi:hypothetical protein
MCDTRASRTPGSLLRTLVPTTIAALLAACACGSDDDEGSCVPNETQSCGDGSRVSTCSAQRTWGPCVSSGRQPDDSTETSSAPTPPAVPSTTGSAAPTPAPSAGQCFDGGDLESLGCAVDDIECCAGSTCVEQLSTGLSYCAALCTTGGDCASGCCAALVDGSASVCSGPESCGGTSTPQPGTAAPIVLPFGSYALTQINRLDLNLYEARSGLATLLIETRLCLVLTLLDDGILDWQGSFGSTLFFDTFSGDVCDVNEVLAL